MSRHFARASTANAISHFREVTEGRAVMLNAQNVPKMTLCVCCDKRRTTMTGTATKAGFVCGMCANPRKVA